MEELRRPFPGQGGRPPGLAREMLDLPPAPRRPGQEFAFTPIRKRVVRANKTCSAGEGDVPVKDKGAFRSDLTVQGSPGSRSPAVGSVRLSRAAAGIRQETAPEKEQPRVVRGGGGGFKEV